MFNYLYYKLYQAALKSSLKNIPNIVASAWFGALIGINIIVINGFLAKINLGHFPFTNPKLGAILVAILIGFSMLFFNENKRAAILKEYTKESNKERIKGNALTAVYVIFPFLLIFVVAFFRPGKI